MLPWERRINSLKELKDLWRNLEQDAGIRIRANSKIFPPNTMIFVFFFDGTYWINSTNKTRDFGKIFKGKKEMFIGSNNFEHVWFHLRKLIDKPLKAWYY